MRNQIAGPNCTSTPSFIIVSLPGLLKIIFYSFVSGIFSQVLFIALLCRSYFCTAGIPDSQRLYLATPINTTGADLVLINEILKTPLYSEIAVSLIVRGLVSE